MPSPRDTRKKNRRLSDPGPKRSKPTRTPRKTKSLSNKHKKNINITILKKDIYKIQKLTREILELTENNEDSKGKLKTINRKNFNINKIEKILSDLKDDILDEIEENKEERPDMTDVRRFDPELPANPYL